MPVELEVMCDISSFISFTVTFSEILTNHSHLWAPFTIPSNTFHQKMMKGSRLCHPQIYLSGIRIFGGLGFFFFFKIEQTREKLRKLSPS